MRHRVAGTKFNVDFDHRRSLLKNLLTSYILHEHIVSTEAKVKALKRLFDKVVTRAKQNDLHSRRLLRRFILDHSAFIKLFTVLLPKFSTRTSGYSRTQHLIDPRVGDSARMMRIEMVFDAVSETKNASDELGVQSEMKKKQRKSVVTKVT